MQDELWPPNPNELDTAAVMSCFCDTLGTMSMPSISSIGSCTTRCVNKLAYTWVCCIHEADKIATLHGCCWRPAFQSFYGD